MSRRLGKRSLVWDQEAHMSLKPGMSNSIMLLTKKPTEQDIQFFSQNDS